MSSDFFFLLSSLPQLNPGDKLPFSYGQFLENCADRLTPGELATLRGLSLNPEAVAVSANSKVLNDWLDWERDIRNAIADFRTRQLKQPLGRWNRETRDIHPSDRRRVEEILASLKGREREDALVLFRLHAIEELAQAHPYDFDGLICYALRLLLLIRSRDMDPVSGAEKFGELAKMTKEQAVMLRAETN